MSFETAKLVFDDPLAISRPDPHPDGDRWQTAGLVGSVTLFVVHTYPEPDAMTGKIAGRIISARRRLHTKGELMKKDNSSRLTPAQTAELQALAALPNDRIDTRSLPEQRDWSGAQRGVFFRPIKKQLTLRLDADLIEWFKCQATSGEGYQTNINKALREYMTQHGG